METGTVTVKGQTTLPKRVREFLNIKPGDQVTYVFVGNDVVLRAKNKSIKDLKNILPPPKKAATLEEIEDGIMQGALKSARS